MINPMLYVGLFPALKRKVVNSLPVKVIENDKRDHLTERVKLDPIDIINEAEIYYGLESSILVSKTRLSKVVTARQIAMYVIRMVTNLHLKEIGDLFNRDHSTVLYSIDTVKDLYQTDKRYREKMNDFLKSIQ
jgi:chromosomal replication initiator protein